MVGSFDGNQNQCKIGGEAQVPIKYKKSFSEKNGLTEVEENDSNDTLVLDDKAHKVNLHTCGHFFCMR